MPICIIGHSYLYIVRYTVVKVLKRNNLYVYTKYVLIYIKLEEGNPWRDYQGSQRAALAQTRQSTSPDTLQNAQKTVVNTLDM